MLLFDGALGVIALGVWIFCIIDVITTPDANCRNLPKLLWLVIVILLADIGSIAWLVAGRTWESKAQTPAAKGRGGAFPSARARTPRASNPDDDDDFLAGLQARADEQRRRAREAQGPDDPPGSPPPSV
jgi:hypothetical protein